MSRTVNYRSCNSCKLKKQVGRCPMQHRIDCPHILAEIATHALAHEEAIKLISIEAIAQAARTQGFTGELRKTIIKTI